MRQTIWTQEMINEMNVLLSNSRTYSEIALLMSRKFKERLTRSAIAGKVYRENKK